MTHYVSRFIWVVIDKVIEGHATYVAWPLRQVVIQELQDVSPSPKPANYDHVYPTNKYNGCLLSTSTRYRGANKR